MCRIGCLVCVGRWRCGRNKSNRRRRNQLKIALPFPGHRGNPVNCFLAPRSCFLAPREDTRGGRNAAQSPMLCAEFVSWRPKIDMYGRQETKSQVESNWSRILFLGFGRASRIRRRETKNCFLALDMCVCVSWVMSSIFFVERAADRPFFLL